MVNFVEHLTALFFECLIKTGSVLEHELLVHALFKYIFVYKTCVVI